MQLENLKNYITKDEPFGPIDTVDIAHDDVDVLEALFAQYNVLYKGLRKRPSIIIGRKGSGKTAYLRSVFFDHRYTFYTEIDTPEAISEVIKIVQGISREAVFPETVAKLWETIIWISIFSEMRKHITAKDGKETLDAYLSKIGIREGNSIDTILWTIADTLSERMKDKPLGVVSEFLRRFDKVSFEDARKVTQSFLKKEQKNFVVLMDSMDRLDVKLDTIARSLEGLIKCIGEMNKPRACADIRFCLPAELYHNFQNEISSNPNKDFKRSLKLQWTASELIILGAQRLRLFIAIYNKKLFKQIKNITVNSKNNALRVFSLVLENNLENQYHFQEDTIAYILRHTQLLPRHFLILLNSIFTINKQRRDDFLAITDVDVLKGVRLVEERIVAEIFVAFRIMYPHAEKTCRLCVPELDHYFTLGDLQKVFNRHGKKYFGGGDFFDFKRMLIEIGVIGRFLEETDIYYKARFEYTASHELITSVDDTYCLHPLFSGIYGNGRKSKPVYPYGSDVEDDDYRNR